MYAVLHAAYSTEEDLDVEVLGVYSTLDVAINRMRQLSLEALQKWRDIDVIISENKKAKLRSKIDEIVNNPENKDFISIEEAYLGVFTLTYTPDINSVYIHVAGYGDELETHENWKIQQIPAGETSK